MIDHSCAPHLLPNTDDFFGICTDMAFCSNGPMLAQQGTSFPFHVGIGVGRFLFLFVAVRKPSACRKCRISRFVDVVASPTVPEPLAPPYPILFPHRLFVGCNTVAFIVDHFHRWLHTFGITFTRFWCTLEVCERFCPLIDCFLKRASGGNQMQNASLSTGSDSLRFRRTV